MTSDNYHLPPMTLAGSEGTWAVANGEPISGRFLGMGTSKQDHHGHVGQWPGPDELCSKCRWFEARIFRVTGGYVVASLRATDVPGEQDRLRVERVIGPHEVVEVLTTRKRLPGGAVEPRLSRPAARALAQAATFDRDLEHAYVDRATP